LDVSLQPTGGQDLLDVSRLGITQASFSSQVSISDIGTDGLSR
jgi:hypothetical protein